MNDSTATPCPGPLVWFEVGCDDQPPHTHALLECASCSYIVASGNYNDAAHTNTPLMREGLAA